MNRVALFASVAFVAQPQAFFNTNAGGKLFICATPQSVDLIQSDYEALTWVEVKGVGSIGESGKSTNILTYDTWGTTAMQKAKGIIDAGSPDIELARIPADPGQIILRAAAVTSFNYAFKLQHNDAASVASIPTVIYNRGLVSGPKRPNGRNESFDLEVFTLALNQVEVIVDPTSAGNPPVLTVAPAITGTAQVNNVLTCSTGTFTGDATIVRSFQWYGGGVQIPGAIANTYIPQTADVGKVITCRVIGTNLAGTATSFAAPTSAVIP